MMPVHTFEELNVYVIAAFVLGLIVGVIYDLFRVLRFFMGERSQNHKIISAKIKITPLKIITCLLNFFLDLSFCLVVTVLTVFLFSSYGKGQARIIALITMSFGFAFWYKTLGRFAYPFAALLKKVIYVVLSFIYRHTVKHLLVFAGKIFKLLGKKLKDRELIKYNDKQNIKINRFLRGEDMETNKKNRGTKLIFKEGNKR